MSYSKLLAEGSYRVGNLHVVFQSVGKETVGGLAVEGVAFLQLLFYEKAQLLVVFVL